MQGNPLGVRRHRQDNLGSIRSMIPAMAIASPMFWAVAFEIDTGQIVKDQAHRLGKGPLIKLLFQTDPMAVELIHGAVEVVLLKGLLGLQSAGLGQPSAARLV